MGLSHPLCPASGLGIVTEHVVLVVVAKNHRGFAPIAPPIRGQYDSFGSIDRIDFDPTTRRTLAGFTALGGRNELHTPAPAPSNAFGECVSPEGLRGLLEHVRQGLIFERVRAEDAESTMVRARGRDLGFVMFLASIYDAVVATLREQPEGAQLATRLTERTAFDGLVESALAPVELARDLVEDTPATRGALLDLALFRSWFDARATWPAGNDFGQYSRRELRTRVRDAKTGFATWPLLVEAVEAYERQSLRLGAS